ncbi:DNA-binding transcriptional regulator YiaG [Methylobacterium sp. RAS18]|nr:DNA-binding transcriptional regulator YiaG [Methylobacterium sp. RAS18]
MSDLGSVRSTADAMSAAQMREAMEALGPAQAGGARLLGVDGRTVRRWCTEEGPGGREVPPTAARFLRFLIGSGIKPEEVFGVLSKGVLRNEFVRLIPNGRH